MPKTLYARTWALAGGLAVLCAVVEARPAYAVVIDPVSFDVMGKGETVGKVSMKVSSFGLGGGLIGTQGLVGEFTVTKQKGGGSTMAVKELEQFLGQDHLNWFQKVTRDTSPPNDASGNRLKPPYIDPPKGGYSGPGTTMSWGDHAPWYWNETPKPAGEPKPDPGQLSDQSSGSTLNFEDFPSVVDATGPVAGAEVDFALFLVSDFGNKTYEVLGSGVSWMVKMEAVGTLGVFPHVKCLATGAPFTSEYAKEIRDQFGYTMVPEPSTWLCLGSGLLGLAGRQGRSRGRRRTAARIS